MDPALREYLDKLSESLTKSFDETRSDLKELKTLLQGQTMKLDELSDLKSGVKELEATHDNVADALTPAEETADNVPVLAASAASAKPLNVDATGATAPTPTTCSTDGSGHDTGGNGSVDVSLILWGTIQSFTASLEASLTQPCRLFVALELDTKALTRCSTICFVDETMVFTYMFMADVTQSITRQGQVLRPIPWPSFKCHSGAAYTMEPSSATQVQEWVWPLPARSRPPVTFGPLVWLQGMGMDNTWLEKGSRWEQSLCSQRNSKMTVLLPLGQTGGTNDSMFSSCESKTLFQWYPQEEFSEIIPATTSSRVLQLRASPRRQLTNEVYLCEEMSPYIGAKGRAICFCIEHPLSWGQILRISLTRWPSGNLQLLILDVMDPENTRIGLRHVMLLFQYNPRVGRLISPWNREERALGINSRRRSRPEHLPGIIRPTRILVKWQFLREVTIMGSTSFAVQFTVETMAWMLAGILCFILPQAKPPDTYDKCILSLREMQGIILAACPKLSVAKFKPAGQVQLLMVRENYSAIPNSETVHRFSCGLLTEGPCELMTAWASLCATLRNVRRLCGADTRGHQQHNITTLRIFFCWNLRRPRLLIRAYLGGFCGLSQDKFILILVKIQHRILVSLYPVSKSLHPSAAPFELYDTSLPMELISHIIIVNWIVWAWGKIFVVGEMDPMTSAEAWGKCGSQHLISTGAPNLLLAYMFEPRTFDWKWLLYLNQRTPLACVGMLNPSPASLCIPTILVDDSGHHWVIHLYASIMAGGDQCKCEWSAQYLFGKWAVESGSSQNSAVCVPSRTCDQKQWSPQATLDQWKIAWTLDLEFSANGSQFGQPFLHTPCDPGALALRSLSKIRLGGKPSFKEGGVLEVANSQEMTIFFHGRCCCFDHAYYYSDQVQVGHHYYLDIFLEQVPNDYDYYIKDVVSFDLVQVDLNHGYYCNDYHGDFSTMRDLQTPGSWKALHGNGLGTSRVSRREGC